MKPRAEKYPKCAIFTYLWSTVRTVACWRFLYNIFQEFSRPIYTVAAPVVKRKQEAWVLRVLQIAYFPVDLRFKLFFPSFRVDYLGQENLVLSKELIKVELLPWKIWKTDVSSVSPSSELSFVVSPPLKFSCFNLSTTTVSLETRKICILSKVCRSLKEKFDKGWSGKGWEYRTWTKEKNQSECRGA